MIKKFSILVVLLLSISSLAIAQDVEVNTLDRGARWLMTGIEELDALEDISADEREDVRDYLSTLIDNPELRVDETGYTDFVSTLESEEAIGVVERAFIRVSSPLRFHEGYWVGEMENPDLPLPVQAINDLHIDPYTMRVTVYAQNRVGPNILAPAQAGPGETVERPDGTELGPHPNAVYLNGSGEELTEADGTGAWWVKHSWVLNGEGYNNWQLGATDYSRGGQYVEGTLLEDGITMQMRTFIEGDTLGGVPIDPEEIADEFYGNIRTPIVDTDPATYEITRFEPANLDADAGPIDFTSTEMGTITLVCQEEISAFDGLARSCPTLVSAQSAQDDVPFGEQIRTGIIQGQEDAAAAAAEYHRTDQITTVLCGTSSPISRSGAQTCTAVFVNGQFLVFDVGNNANQAMYDANMPIQDVDAVFITHFHNDHIADLGEIIQNSWIAGREHMLPIYGPTGINQIVDGFLTAYEPDRGYRTGHHGEEIMPSEWSGAESVEFNTPEGDEAVVVYENDGVVVEAFRATHEPIHPAVGFRISYADKLIVISGDTVLTSAVQANSQGADLLVAEIMNFDVITLMEDVNRDIGDERQAILFFDIREYHMDAPDVGTLAQEANVARLALNHYMPVPANDILMNQWFVNPISEIYDGEIIAGGDGTTIIIPLDEE